MSKLQKKVITIGVIAVGGAMIWIAAKSIVRTSWLSDTIGITGLVVTLGAACYFKGLFPGMDKRYYNNPNNKEWE
ncbi:hypothetical protein [Mucilaginibacter sp.]